MNSIMIFPHHEAEAYIGATPAQALAFTGCMLFMIAAAYAITKYLDRNEQD